MVDVARHADDNKKQFTFRAADIFDVTIKVMVLLQIHDRGSLLL